MKNERLVEPIPGNDGPEYIALGTMADPDGKRKAYPMRNDGALKVTCTKQIPATKKNDELPLDPILLAEYTTENEVCDASYIKSFSVKLEDGVSKDNARYLLDAKLTFDVDGELLVKQVPLVEILGRNEVMLPKLPSGDACLFTAHPMEHPHDVDATVNGGEWLGYMLPTKTKIRVTLENVPKGGDAVSIETAWNLVRYTTKGFDEYKSRQVAK